jgi:hypothetical protein
MRHWDCPDYQGAGMVEAEDCIAKTRQRIALRTMGVTRRLSSLPHAGESPLRLARGERGILWLALRSRCARLWEFWPSRPGVTSLCSCKEKLPRESTPQVRARSTASPTNGSPTEAPCSGSLRRDILSRRSSGGRPGRQPHCARRFSRRYQGFNGNCKSEKQKQKAGAAAWAHPPASKRAFPPTAAVFTVKVRSVTKRSR